LKTRSSTSTVLRYSDPLSNFKSCRWIKLIPVSFLFLFFDFYPDLTFLFLFCIPCCTSLIAIQRPIFTSASWFRVGITENRRFSGSCDVITTARSPFQQSCGSAARIAPRDRRKSEIFWELRCNRNSTRSVSAELRLCSALSVSLRSSRLFMG